MFVHPAPEISLWLLLADLYDRQHDNEEDDQCPIGNELLVNFFRIVHVHRVDFFFCQIIY